MRRVPALLLTLALAAGCTPMPPPAPVADAPEPGPRPDPDTAVRNFLEVVKREEPVAERICRTRTEGLNCDFAILVDTRPGAPSNAFQTVNEDGQPVIIFTEALIADARNRDELASVLGHEAAHHIEGHIPRQKRSALAGALIFGAIAAGGGADAGTIRDAQDFGAEIGRRRYSKDMELEADRLGTVIAARAGFDPLRGADFFFRLPDPGDRFLGTHPPNAERREVIAETVASL